MQNLALKGLAISDVDSTLLVSTEASGVEDLSIIIMPPPQMVIIDYRKSWLYVTWKRQEKFNYDYNHIKSYMYIEKRFIGIIENWT